MDHYFSNRWRPLTGRRNVLLSGVLCLVLCASALFYFWSHSRQEVVRQASFSPTYERQDPRAPQNDSPSVQEKASGVSSSTAVQPSISATRACRLLTLTIARQVLGPKAVQQNGSDTVTQRNADTEISQCIYANDSGETIALIVHVALSPLGLSENDTVFGSARPTDVTNESGYGQAAYWNPATSTFNILYNNNWYAINEEGNSQITSADIGGIEAVAHSIVSELS